MSVAHQGSHTGSTIRQAKRLLSRRLLQQPGVTGVGIEAAADGGERIKVYLAEDDPALTAQVPSEVAGYPVVVEVIGTIAPRRAGS